MVSYRRCVGGRLVEDEADNCRCAGGHAECDVEGGGEYVGADDEGVECGQGYDDRGSGDGVDGHQGVGQHWGEDDRGYARGIGEFVWIGVAVGAVAVAGW